MGGPCVPASESLILILSSSPHRPEASSAAAVSVPHCHRCSSLSISDDPRACSTGEKEHRVALGVCVWGGGDGAPRVALRHGDPPAVRCRQRGVPSARPTSSSLTRPSKSTVMSFSLRLNPHLLLFPIGFCSCFLDAFW
jgi:hypothetical protein